MPNIKPTKPTATPTQPTGAKTRSASKAAQAPHHGGAARGALARHHELVSGAQRHLQQNLKDPKQQALIQKHAKSQHPDYFVLCCSDSRYEPNEVFDIESGRLFTYSNAGNMVTDESSSDQFDPGMAGTLAYALQVLQVKHILVLGHTGCGLVGAVMADARASKKGKQEGGALHEWISRWMKHAGHLKRQVDDHYDFNSSAEQDLAAVGEHVLRQVERLRSLNIVREAFERGALQDVIGAVYEIHNSGNVSVWDDDQEKFVSMSQTTRSSLPERHSKRGG